MTSILCHSDILRSILCVQYFALDILSVDILRIRYFAIQYSDVQNFAILIFCVFDILRFDILLSDILSVTRSNHTDAVGRAVNVLMEAAGSMFRDTERGVYRRAAANETSQQRSAGGPQERFAGLTAGLAASRTKYRKIKYRSCKISKQNIVF